MNRWARIEDEKPKKGVDVLIYPPEKHWSGHKIYVAQLRQEGIYESWVYVQDNSSYRLHDITHWKLPDSPE